MTFVDFPPDERKTTTRLFLHQLQRRCLQVIIIVPTHSSKNKTKNNKRQFWKTLWIIYKGFHEDFIVGRHPEFLLRLVSASRVLTFAKGSTFPPYSLGRNLSSKVRMSGCLQRMRQVWMPGLLMSRRVLRCHLEVLENMITYIYIYIYLCTYGWEPLSIHDYCICIYYCTYI